MEKNDFIKITNTSDNIKREFIDKVVINKVNADILFSKIQQNQILLSDDECFKELPCITTTNNNKTLNFLVNDASYFVNVRLLSLAFICLIFDITISNGLASFLLGAFGIDYATIKLDGLEKCVAYKIKTEKRISAEQLIALNKCNFTNNNTNCGHYKNDGTCGNWKEDDIQRAIGSLMSKKIINLKGDAYEIVF